MDETMRPHVVVRVVIMLRLGTRENEVATC